MRLLTIPSLIAVFSSGCGESQPVHSGSSESNSLAVESSTEQIQGNEELVGPDTRLNPPFAPYSLEDYEITKESSLPGLSGSFVNLKFEIKEGRSVDPDKLRKHIFQSLAETGWQVVDFDSSVRPDWGSSPNDLMMELKPQDNSEGVHTYFQRVHINDSGDVVILYTVAFWS